MTSPLLGAIARQVFAGLAPLLFDLSFRSVGATTLRAPAGASAGASSVGLAGAPAGWAGVVAGDTFASGTGTYTVTAAVTPFSGSLTVPFSPPLAAAILVNAQVIIRHVDPSVVRGMDEQVDVFRIESALVQPGDWKILLLAQSLPGGVVPKAGDQVVTRTGRVVTVQNVAWDPAMGTYTLQAK